MLHTNGLPLGRASTKEIAMTDPRLVRPSWRGRTNVDALTIACIEHAEQIVREKAPEIAHEFVVTQGSYQGESGDPDSGTTHRLGGGVDIRWCGHAVCYRALREAGMFIWHRYPWQGDWPDHFHGAPIGHPYMDYRLAAQEDSYLAGGDGLGGVDDGPRLNPIPRPVWPWPPEDPMADYADQLDRIEKKLDAERERDRVDREKARKRHKAVLAGFDRVMASVADDATRGTVLAVRDEILAAIDEPEPAES